MLSTPPVLPTDPQELRAFAALMQARLMAAQAETQAAKAQLIAKEAELAATKSDLQIITLHIEKLKLEIGRLKRERFGAASEKRDTLLAQYELQLEDLEVSRAEMEARTVARPELCDTQKTAHPKRQPRRQPLPDGLPVEEIVLEPDFAAAGDADLAHWSRIGVDETDVLERVPAVYKIQRYVRPKYVHAVTGAILQAAAPPLPVAHGKLGAAFLAHLLIATRRAA